MDLPKSSSLMFVALSPPGGCFRHEIGTRPSLEVGVASPEVGVLECECISRTKAAFVTADG
jgi:hypothetical protein